MKKLLFISIALFVGLNGFAQEDNKTRKSTKTIRLKKCNYEKVGGLEYGNAIIYFDLNKYTKDLKLDYDNARYFKYRTDTTDEQLMSKSQFELIQRQSLTHDTLMILDLFLNSGEKYDSSEFVRRNHFFLLKILRKGRLCIYNKDKNEYEKKIVQKRKVRKVKGTFMGTSGSERYFLIDNEISFFKHTWAWF